MTPTFKMHGSKARTAPWLCSHFPKRFCRYLDPFAGRGNVYFRASTSCRFDHAVLGDLHLHPFLTALRDYAGDYRFVEAGPIDREVWLRWKSAPPSMERWLSESFVARFGSSYDFGPNTAGGDSLNGHSRENTVRRMKEARRLMQGVVIVPTSWEQTLNDFPFMDGDVLYLDPPYDVAQNVHYPNIDHNALLRAANNRPGMVFISGYATPRYESALSGWNRAVRVRSSVGKGVASKGSSGKKPKVEEVLWWKST